MDCQLKGFKSNLSWGSCGVVKEETASNSGWAVAKQPVSNA